VGVGGTVRNAQAVTRVASGELRFTVQVAPDTSFGNVSWDLTTPVDLTEGGTADAFAFDLSEQTIDATLTLFVYSGGSSSTAGSSASLSLGGPGHYEVPFSVFASGTPGNPGLPPADFTAANRIGLNFTSTTDVTGDFVIAGPFQTVPEPELALLASAAALLLVASRLANAFPGVGRFGHERAHAPRPGRDRRDR
jgi:hypothetical protein